MYDAYPAHTFVFNFKSTSSCNLCPTFYRRRLGTSLVWVLCLVAHANGLAGIASSQLDDRADLRWQRFLHHETGLSNMGNSGLASRQLLVEEFKAAPSASDKEAEAAKILAQKPDNLLRNLKVKAQETTNWFPEGCDVAKGGMTRRYVSANSSCTVGASELLCCQLATCPPHAESG